MIDFILDIASQVILHSQPLRSLTDGHTYVAVRKRSHDVCLYIYLSIYIYIYMKSLCGLKLLISDDLGL